MKLAVQDEKQHLEDVELEHATGGSDLELPQRLERCRNCGEEFNARNPTLRAHHTSGRCKKPQ